MKNKKLLIILSILLSILALGAIAALTGNILVDETYTVLIDYVIDGEDKPFETVTEKFAAGSMANIVAPVKDGYRPRQESFVAIVNSNYHVTVIYDSAQEVLLQLCFDKDINTELNDWNQLTGNAFCFEVFPANGATFTDETYTNGALKLSKNAVNLLTCSKTLFDGSDYCIISFDWRATDFGNSSNLQGIFGCLSYSGVTDFVAGVDRLDGSFYRGGRIPSLWHPSLKDSYLETDKKVSMYDWYSFEILVNIETGLATVSIYTESGDYFVEPYTVQGFKILNNEEVAFRFGHCYNLYHQPEFDNFKITVY